MAGSYILYWRVLQIYLTGKRLILVTFFYCTSYGKLCIFFLPGWFLFWTVPVLQVFVPCQCLTKHGPKIINSSGGYPADIYRIRSTDLIQFVSNERRFQSMTDGCCARNAANSCSVAFISFARSGARRLLATNRMRSTDLFRWISTGRIYNFQAQESSVHLRLKKRRCQKLTLCIYNLNLSI